MNWSLIGTNNNRISEYSNLIFPLAKSPNLEEILFRSCWILPTNLFFCISQSPGEGEDYKTEFWDQKYRRFFRSCVYATGSNSRMCMCCCLTSVHVRVYAIITCAYVYDTVTSHSRVWYAVISHSPICVCCGRILAHMRMLQPCFRPHVYGVTSRSHVCML